MDRSSTRRSKLDLRRRPLYWAVQGGSVQYQAVQSGLARLTPLQLVGTMLDRRSSRIGSQTPSAIRNAGSAGNRDILWYLAVQGGSVQYQAVQSAPSTSTWVPGGPRWIGPSTKRSRVDLRRRYIYWAIQGGSAQYPAVQRGPRWSTSTLSGPRWTSAVVDGPEWTCKVDLRPGESGLSWTRSGRDVG